jgi:oligopeptide transport system substrate-binding protein
MRSTWPGNFRRCTWVAVAIALAMVLCGCQRSSEPAASAATEAGPLLRRGLGAEPETLDPRLASDNASLAVVGDLYEGLATETPDGRIVPGAAQSWSVSADGLVWTFRLRQGLRWSNGDALTARDFVASFDAVMSPGSKAPNAALLDGIQDPSAPDDSTIVLRLSRPLPYLPAVLALPVTAPLYANTESARHSPGNGPFRLVSWQRGERISLERNPYFHAADEVRIDKVVHLLITDLTTELNLYRTGALDLTSEVPNAQLPWIRENLAGELKIAPYLSTYAYAVNLSRLPDVRARMALAMAVDRDRITQQVTGAGERAAYGWVPDGIPGYAAARFEWSRMPYGDVANDARRLWSAARADGAAPARIRLCTDASANHRRTAVALADLWHSSIGVETDIVELEWNVYLDTRHNPGDCDLVRLGWSADFVDAEAFAGVFQSGNAQNTLGYSNARYDEMLRQSRVAADPSRRTVLLQDAEAQLLADVPVIPVFYRVSKRLVKPYVQGYTANPLGHVASRDLSIAPH